MRLHLCMARSSVSDRPRPLYRPDRPVHSTALPLPAPHQCFIGPAFDPAHNASLGAGLATLGGLAASGEWKTAVQHLGSPAIAAQWLTMFARAAPA